MSESDGSCRQVMMQRLSCMRSCRVGGEAARRMIGHSDCCMLRQHLGYMPQGLQSLLMDINDLFWLDCCCCRSGSYSCC